MEDNAPGNRTFRIRISWNTGNRDLLPVEELNPKVANNLGITTAVVDVEGKLIEIYLRIIKIRCWALYAGVVEFKALMISRYIMKAFPDEKTR